MVEPACGSGCHDDGLCIDHLAHHTARAVGSAHQVGRQAQLFSRHLLHAAEQHVRRGIRPGERHAQPAHHGAKEGVEHAGVGEGEAQCRIGA
ncbi:hypothetical protein D3C81_2135820 [compost metagenome]